MTCSIIADGYTEDGFVRGVRGLYADAHFRYRPLIVEERDSLRAAINKANGTKEALTLVVGCLNDRLESWDVKDHEGNAVPKTPHGIRRLRPSLFDRLYEIVAGYAPSDMADDAPQQMGDDYATAALKAAENGDTHVGAQQENDRKNLPVA